jgi:hypothetical protein
MNKASESKIVMALPYQASIGYLTKLTNHPLLLLEKHEHFVKASSRNRCYIYGANGLHLLSIPVRGGRSHKQLYSETCIDYRQNWPRQHWHSLKSAYGKSPFFEYYETELGHLYAQRPELHWEWNLALFHWILKSLKLQVNMAFTQSFEKPLQAGLIDLRGLELRSPDQNWPVYYQGFASKHGFLADLAGIDLLFNLGPAASLQYLKSIGNR